MREALNIGASCRFYTLIFPRSSNPSFSHLNAVVTNSCKASFSLSQLFQKYFLSMVYTFEKKKKVFYNNFSR